MIHYHGGPITPDTCAIRAWSSRHAFVSFARPDQINLAAAVTQSFALDNGAFSLWKASTPTDWSDYYAFVARWLCHPKMDFAVVPDVIEGSEEANDQLAEAWPFPRHQAAVVWHTNESVERLVRLARTWPRVALGSSGEYDVSKPSKLVGRLRDVLSQIVTPEGYPICKLHGLRMLSPKVFEHIPLSSADSTNVARNIGIDSKWKGTYSPVSKETRTSVLVERVERTVSVDRLIAWNDTSEETEAA